MRLLSNTVAGSTIIQEKVLAEGVGKIQSYRRVEGTISETVGRHRKARVELAHGQANNSGLVKICPCLSRTGA